MQVLLDAKVKIQRGESLQGPSNNNNNNNNYSNNAGYINDNNGYGNDSNAVIYAESFATAYAEPINYETDDKYDQFSAKASYGEKY